MPVLHSSQIKMYIHQQLHVHIIEKYKLILIESVWGSWTAKSFNVYLNKHVYHLSVQNGSTGSLILQGAVKFRVSNDMHLILLIIGQFHQVLDETC